MNDQQVWDRSVVIAETSYYSLPTDVRSELDKLIHEIMQLKKRLVELVTYVGSSAVCRTCGGECCLLGKYHVSVLDILAYRITGVDAVVPDFSTSPFCPYSGASGCRMPPDYRPLTCVIFNCQTIEDRLTAIELATLHKHEICLRDTVTSAGRICDLRLDRPLLLSAS